MGVIGAASALLNFLQGRRPPARAVWTMRRHGFNHVRNSNYPRFKENLVASRWSLRQPCSIIESCHQGRWQWSLGRGLLQRQQTLGIHSEIRLPDPVFPECSVSMDVPGLNQFL